MGKMIDARGRACPEPVLMIKKAMESKENSYSMMVDNRVSVENVARFARHNRYETEVKQAEDGFILTMTAGRS